MPDSPDKIYIHTNSSWRALQYFNLYRFIVAFLFVALIWIGQLPEPLGVSNSFLFAISAHIDLGGAGIFWFFINLRKPRYNLQVAAQVFFDIFIISLMMYASDGLNSGFGMLLVIVVAGGSILSAGRIAILFAAIASLSVIGQELYIKLALLYTTPNYTHVALLGITFFFTAILGHVLARRVRESEALANQRAADIEGLAKLNEHIVQRLQFGVIVLDEYFRVRLINEAAQKLLNCAGSADNQHIERVSPLLASKLKEWLQIGIEHTFLVRSEAEDLDLQVSFTRLRPDTRFGFLVFLDGMAVHRQRAQEMKLSSLGRLAASIAHEIRNPLSAISHAGQLLFESDSIGDEDLRLLQIIMEHSRRMNAIIENVQKISKRQPSVPDQIEIKPWLEDFIDSYIKHHQLSPAAIRLVIEADDLKVYMDASQLNQVLSNLCENAIRYSTVMPLVELRCGIRAETDRPFLDVIDYGPGIREDILNNLFEPFITSDLHGSGLGLYISRELCEANQASLSLYNNSSSGCCFRITFAYYQTQGQHITA